jgi:GNAT superfamily N-acetyltransferase
VAAEAQEFASVRPAVAADAAGLSELIRSLAKYFLRDPEHPEDAEAFFLTVTPEAMSERLEGDDFRYHVAEQRGELVGCVGMMRGGHLYHLFVAESCHRQGLALRLWEVARRAALAVGEGPAFTVNSSLSAVGFYRRIGFAEDGSVVEKDGLAFQPMVLQSPSEAPPPA